MDEDFPRVGLNGQVTLVTGAARGLGRAISLALAHAGADVALGLRDIQADGCLQAEIEKLGRKALPLQMNMTRTCDSGRQLKRHVLRKPGSRAGDDPPEERMHYHHEFAGGLCFAADRVGVLHDKGRYRSSHEVPGFRVGKYNIRVNAVAPTFIHTPGTELALADPEFRADVVERIAAPHRIGEPMEVAGAVVFLATSGFLDYGTHDVDRWWLDGKMTHGLSGNGFLACWSQSGA